MKKNLKKRRNKNSIKKSSSKNIFSVPEEDGSETVNHFLGGTYNLLRRGSIKAIHRLG